jgi:uncharacterized membrane protein
VPRLAAAAPSVDPFVLPVAAVAEPASPLAALANGTRSVLGAAGDGFALPAESQLAGAQPLEFGVRPVTLPLLANAETIRPFQLAAMVLRGIELPPTEQAELAAVRFTLTGRGESVSIDELQRTFRSTAFADQFDQLRSNVQEDLNLDRTMTISVAGVSLGLSVVYVLWLIRGGVLMGSYLSALPAWRVLDPLPVLSRVDDEAEEDDEALDAVQDRGGNALRGF